MNEARKNIMKTTALPALDTRHVEDFDFRVYHPSYAIVSIQAPEWGWDKEDDNRRIVVGSTIDGPFAVKLSAGQSLAGVAKAMGYNPAFGEIIYSAIAMDENDYQDYIQAQIAMDVEAYSCANQ